MEDEHLDELQTHSFHNVPIYSVITRDPARVTQWITDINAYLSLPTVEPKIVYLTLLPYGVNPSVRSYVLQILVHQHCLFFHLSPRPPPQIPDSLRQFVENRLGYIFVGANMDTDALRLFFDCGIGGNDMRRAPRMVLSRLDRVFKSRPLQFFLTNWTAERLGVYEIRFYAFEGFATYLTILGTYRITVSFCMALFLTDIVSLFALAHMLACL